MYPLKYLEKITQLDNEQKEFDEHQKLYPKNPFTDLTKAKSEVKVEAVVMQKIAEIEYAVKYRSNIYTGRDITIDGSGIIRIKAKSGGEIITEANRCEIALMINGKYISNFSA
jgi:hypothetical protein